MSKPKLNARHIEVATAMLVLPKTPMFAMQWQNKYGFGVSNFYALEQNGLVDSFDVGDAYGRKKYAISPDALEKLLIWNLYDPQAQQR